jgi:molybdate transport system permease protein
MTESYLSPLWISFKTVLTTTVITFFIGILAARWMARYSGRGKSLIDGIFILPLVLPPTVVGFSLLTLFGKNGPLGEFFSWLGTTIVFSWPATVIAAVVMTFPLMYISARAGFEQVDINVENAARTLGAGEWRVFWTVTMPMAWPAVVAATILTFARALGEFGATLMLAGNNDRALVLSLIVMVISFASLAALAYWKRKTPKTIDIISTE